MKKTFLCIVILLFNVQVSFGEQTLIMLQDNETLTAIFTQERHLDGFEGAIKSNGRFSLKPDGAIVWQSLAPFKTRLLISKDGIKQTVEGQETLDLSVSKIPALAYLQSVFEACLKGDWNALEEQFGVKPILTGDRWTFDIPSENATISLPFARIRLAGAKFVEAIELHKSNKDVDRIYLTNHQIVKNVSASTNDVMN